MAKKDSIDPQLDLNSQNSPFELGPAYLDYCVKKGWLTKTGDGPKAQYELTETGRVKLDNVSLNFDLSAITSKGDGPKKRRKRHKK